MQPYFLPAAVVRQSRETCSGTRRPHDRQRCRSAREVPLGRIVWMNKSRRRGATGVQRLNSAKQLFQRQPGRLLGDDYELHRLRHPQQGDQLPRKDAAGEVLAEGKIPVTRQGLDRGLRNRTLQRVASAGETLHLQSGRSWDLLLVRLLRRDRRTGHD